MPKSSFLGNQMPENSAPKTHDPYEAFRFRNYRFFAAGNLLSVIGRRMLSVGVGWEIYQRTHSASALGFIGLVQAIPIFLLAIPAGHAADRFSRKRILLVTQFLSALASVGLAICSFKQELHIVWMFALLFFHGSARAFGWTARAAFVANLVPPESFGNAITWNNSALQIGAVAGPVLGGIVIAKFGFHYVCAIDAFLALIFLALLLPIIYRQTHERNESEGWRGLFLGLNFVWKTKTILAMITLDLFAVLFGGATALLPIFADEILHCGAVGLGWLRAAPPLGAFAMGLVLAHLPPMGRAGRAMLQAVVCFGLATVVFGLSKSFWLSMLMLALTGFADNVSVVVRQTLVQLLMPNAMRGRVSAVNNVFSGSSNEIGAFESGITAAWFGPVFSVVAGGVATILVVLAVIRLWPQVLGLGSFASIKSETHSEEPIPLAVDEEIAGVK